jgi:hypothetical protein
MLRRKRQPIKFVLIEGGAPEAEVERLRELLARRKLTPDVNAGLPLTGGPPTELVWGVYLALAVPITSFFAALGTQAGKDAYAAAKDWIGEMIAARRSEAGPGHITLSMRRKRVCGFRRKSRAGLSMLCETLTGRTRSADTSPGTTRAAGGRSPSPTTRSSGPRYSPPGTTAAPPRETSKPPASSLEFIPRANESPARGAGLRPVGLRLV